MYDSINWTVNYSNSNNYEKLSAMRLRLYFLQKTKRASYVAFNPHLWNN